MDRSSAFNDARRDSGAPRCDGMLRETLHLYVDGELPAGEQAALFAHLSSCAECRSLLESVLQFRRMVRLEKTAVPPAADDAFFQRLAEHKERRPEAESGSHRRRARRRWTAPVAAAAAAFLLFAAAFNLTSPPQGSPLVVGEEEQVELPEQAFAKRPAIADRQAIYVFYPGLTVEAPRTQEPHPPETL